MKQEITVAALGPGDPGLMNSRTIDAISKADSVFLRTSRHPSADWLKMHSIPFSSFDYLYESCGDFSELYDCIADTLWEGKSGKNVVYCVPDPFFDLSVRRICEKKPLHAEISFIPGTGLTDIYLSKLYSLTGITALYSTSAAEFSLSFFHPAVNTLVTEINDCILAGETKEKLACFLDDEEPVFFFSTAEDQPQSIPLYELDRQKHYSHLSAVFVPGKDYTGRNQYVFSDLLSIMHRLRAPDGCPWDYAQTHESLKTYLIEEAWECIAAIERNDPDNLSEELGDLLFQIVFHADIGLSYDEFSINDVINCICRKMIRRHPHVFSCEKVAGKDEVREKWEKIKREETGSKTIGESMEQVPVSLPALKYAAALIRKARQVPAFEFRLKNSRDELRRIAERFEDPDAHISKEVISDLLFACVEICSVAGEDPEILLHHASERYKKHFRQIENDLKNCGKSLECLTFEELCVYLKHVEGEIE